MRLWLSFTDDGGESLGVAIVDVTDAEIAAATVDVRRRFPRAREGAGAIAAGVRKAGELGCNPGGTVLCVQVPAVVEIPADCLGRLLQEPELYERNLVDRRISDRLPNPKEYPDA